MSAFSFTTHFNMICRSLAASSFFSQSPVTEWVDGLRNADYYAVEFACGFRLGFEFLHQNGGSVRAPVPIAQHARRHLRRWDSLLVDVPMQDQEPERTAKIAKFADSFPELTALRDHQVYRMGDDGNAVAVGVPTTGSDAECWVAEEDKGVRTLFDKGVRTLFGQVMVG